MLWWLGGQEIATKHLWSASLSRAAGEKVQFMCFSFFFHDLAKGEYVDEYFVYCCIQVLDNPKLLKRSLRREEQQRQKSSKKW